MFGWRSQTASCATESIAVGQAGTGLFEYSGVVGLGAASAERVVKIEVQAGLVVGAEQLAASPDCGGPVCSDRFFGFLSGIIVRRNRGGGNVKISFIDFQGLWEGRETVLSFSVLSTDRHFHGRLRCALCRPC